MNRNFRKSKTKYANKSVTYGGQKFDSKKEMRRFIYLQTLEKAGEISDLQTQVTYELIPTQREPSRYTKTGREVKGKAIELSVRYVADFVYKDKEGNVIVEDTKGFRTADYIIKRKLMLYMHGIKVKEI